MRIFAAILILGVVIVVDVNADSYSFTVNKNDTEIFESCIKKIGFSEKELTAALRDYDKNADEKVKCFYGCLFKAYHVLKDDGTIDINAAIKYYQVENDEADQKIVMDCSKNLKGDNDCETAHTVDTCFYTSKQS